MFTSNKKKSSKKNNIEDFNDIVNQIMSGKMDIPKSKKIDKNEDNDFCYDATSIDNAFNNALSERVNKDKKNKSKKMHNNEPEYSSDTLLDDDPDIVLGPIRYPTPLVTIECDENIDTDSDKTDNVVAADYDSSRTIRIVCEDGVTKTSILKMTDGIKTMSIDMAANTHMHADIPNVVSESEDIGEITRLLLKSILPCFYPMGIYSYTTIKKNFKNVTRYNKDQFYFYERNNFVTTYIVTPSSFESLKNVLDKARDADLLNELLIAILNMVESHGFSSRYISDNNNESMRFSMLIGTREQIHQNAAFENMLFNDINTLIVVSDKNTDLSIEMIDTFFRSYQLYAIVYPTIIPWFAQYGMKDDVVTEILEINEKKLF